MRIVWANRAACDSAGLVHKQLIGRHCFEIWQKRSEPCPDCPVQEAIATGAPQERETHTPDGKVWDIRGYPVRDEDDGIIGGVEVTLDITDRHTEQEARRESEERFRQIAENIGEVVWL
jgi:PAS domain S-box-containing protein